MIVDAPIETSRPFRIVLDHPQHHVLRRLWRRISVISGGTLLTIGLTASIPAVPASLAVLSFVIGWATTEPGDPDRWPADDVPVRDVLLVWAITAPLAIGGSRIGLGLVRRHRTLVLFLRRFGHDDAQDAVTFAALRTIGPSWRVVTLDDAEMEPIGVATAPRVFFRAGQVGVRYLLATGHFLGLRTFPVLIMTGWVLLALGLAGPAFQLAWTGTTTADDWIRAIDPFIKIVASVFDGRAPLEYLGPTLPGLFAVLAMAAALSFGVMIVSMAALILAFPLSTVIFFLSSSAASVQEAELAKTATVSSVDGIREAARKIALRSRKVFGPRLVVIRVASRVWRDAVSQLAALSSLPLIDISEPTENVLWELEELIQRFGNKCVVIGHYNQVTALATSYNIHRPSSIEGRLARLLHDRDVLAYTTDKPGLRRFARALRGELLTRSA